MAINYGPKFLHELRDGFHRDLSRANTNQTCASPAELEPLDFVAPRDARIEFGDGVTAGVVRIQYSERVRFKDLGIIAGPNVGKWGITMPDGATYYVPKDDVPRIHAELVALRDEHETAPFATMVGTRLDWCAHENGMQRDDDETDEELRARLEHKLLGYSRGALTDPDDLAGKSEAELGAETDPDPWGECVICGASTPGMFTRPGFAMHWCCEYHLQSALMVAELLSEQLRHGGIDCPETRAAAVRRAAWLCGCVSEGMGAVSGHRSRADIETVTTKRKAKTFRELAKQAFANIGLAPNVTPYSPPDRLPKCECGNGVWTVDGVDVFTQLATATCCKCGRSTKVKATLV